MAVGSDEAGQKVLVFSARNAPWPVRILGSGAVWLNKPSTTNKMIPGKTLVNIDTLVVIECRFDASRAKADHRKRHNLRRDKVSFVLASRLENFWNYLRTRSEDRVTVRG